MANEKVPPIALIMAGGRGSRLRPFTDKVPKPMMLIKGKPILEYGINELKRNGIKDIVILISYKGDKIKNYFKDGSSKGVHIRYVKRTYKDSDSAWNGKSLKLPLQSIVKNYSSKDILAMNGDDIFQLNIAKMYALHKKEKALITISLVKLEDATGRGVIKLEKNRIVNFVEKPNNVKNKMINSGVYIMNAQKVLDLLPKKELFSLEKDFYQKIVNKQKVYGYVSKKRWCAIDTVKTYKKVLNGTFAMNITG